MGPLYRIRFPASLGLLYASAAFAVGPDADGQRLPVTDGALETPSLMVAPPQLAPGLTAFGLRAGLEIAPLIRNSTNGEEAVVRASNTTRIGVTTRPIHWLTMSAQLPIRTVTVGDLDLGPALGDASARVWLRPGIRGPVSLSAGLGVDLPTGSVDTFSSSGRLVPSVYGAASINVAPFVVTAVAHMRHQGPAILPRATGGALAGGGLDVRYVRGRLGTGIGVRGTIALNELVRERRGTPVEVAADLRYRIADRFTVHALGSRGLSKAAGTPVWRADAGLAVQFGKAGKAPSDQAVSPRRIVVVDPTGTPVAGAKLVVSDGTTVTADVNGNLEYPRKTDAVIQASGLVSQKAPNTDGTVALDYAPVPLLVRVDSASGQELTAAVTLSGPEERVLSGDHQFESELLPGSWSLTVKADGYGSQTRVIEVAPRRTHSVTVDAVLLQRQGEGALEVRVVDPNGRSVEGSEIRLDGVGIGTLGQGAVNIEGLAERETEVVIDSPYFEEQTSDVLVAPDTEATFDLYYKPGTVRVTARSEVGPIPDGLVYVDGPRALAPLELGESGEKLVRLSEGTWDLLLSSPAYGLQERTITVEPNGPVPLDAAFVLSAEQGGEADVIVRALDVDGQPLENVAIRVNGVGVGTTGTGGELRLFGLTEGWVDIEGVAEGLAVHRDSIKISDGLQSVTLGMAWDPGTLRVAAHSASGPADAQIDFAGPSEYPGDRLGPPGRKLFLDVPKGEWEIVASHKDGMEVAWAVVGEEPGHLTDVEIGIGDEVGDGSLEVIVTGPDGKPVPGASVLLDGRLLADTASGGRIRVRGLREGTRQLEVHHPHYHGLLLSSLVTTDTPAVAARLEWLPGLIDLRVRSGSANVDDAVAWLAGPDQTLDVDLSSDGFARIPATVGTWEVVVSSVEHGLGETVVEVPEEANGPTDAVVDLTSTASAIIRVIDTRGEPVDGVRVSIGSEELKTDPSGTVMIPLEGEATVTLSHPALKPVQPVTLSSERKERLIEVVWRREPVAIEAFHDGKPVSVRIRAYGPERIDTVLIEGAGTIALPPGAWELVAEPANGLGAARRFVDLQPDSPSDTVRFDLAQAQVKSVAGGLELLNVLFATGEDAALNEYASVLEEIAATIVADPKILAVEIQGHTDSVGDVAYNYGLSRRRAQSIRDALTELGVPPDLLTARGYGPTRPLGENDTEEGRAANRRVDFLFDFSEGRP